MTRTALFAAILNAPTRQRKRLEAIVIKGLVDGRALRRKPRSVQQPLPLQIPGELELKPKEPPAKPSRRKGRASPAKPDGRQKIVASAQRPAADYPQDNRPAKPARIKAARRSSATRRPPRPPKCGTPAEDNRAPIITPQGVDQAHYEVRSANELVTSHDPASFIPDARYPADVQERDYLHDVNEQVKVRRAADHLNPRILIHRAPTPIDGPSITTEDGCVLGGNGRGMATRLAYGEGKAQAYRDELLCRASEFGLDPRAIAKVPDPVLVRVMKGYRCNSDRAQLAKAVRRLNVALTNAIDDTALGVSQARQLSPSTLAGIGELLAGEGTLRERLREEPRAFLRLLEGDGIVTPQNRSEWVTASGGLTEAAKDRIEAMFVGRVLGNADRVRSTTPALMGKLERAIPFVVRVAARNPSYDVSPQLNRAVDLINDANTRGQELEQVLSQESLFGGEKVDEDTRDLARMLVGSGPNQVRDRFRTFAKDADFDPSQPLMFGTPPTREQTFRALASSKPGAGRYLGRGIVVKQKDGLARIMETAEVVGKGKLAIQYLTGPRQGQRETIHHEDAGEVMA